MAARGTGPIPTIPTEEELEAAQTGLMYHVAGPGRPHQLAGVRHRPKSYVGFTEFLTRDIVLLASESTADGARKRRTGASSST